MLLSSAVLGVHFASHERCYLFVSEIFTYWVAALMHTANNFEFTWVACWRCYLWLASMFFVTVVCSWSKKKTYDGLNNFLRVEYDVAIYTAGRHDQTRHNIAILLVFSDIAIYSVCTISNPSGPVSRAELCQKRWLSSTFLGSQDTTQLDQKSTLDYPFGSKTCLNMSAWQKPFESQSASRASLPCTGATGRQWLF